MQWAGLKAIYRDVQQLNQHMAERIHTATSQDAPVNVLILPDPFAKEVNYEIEDQLEGPLPQTTGYEGESILARVPPISIALCDGPKAFAPANGVFDDAANPSA